MHKCFLDNVKKTRYFLLRFRNSDEIRGYCADSEAINFGLYLGTMKHWWWGLYFWTYDFSSFQTTKEILEEDLFRQPCAEAFLWYSRHEICASRWLGNVLWWEKTQATVSKMILDLSLVVVYVWWHSEKIWTFSNYLCFWSKLINRGGMCTNRN